MVALGGTGSITGPIMGGLILELFPEVFGFLADYRQVIYGAVLITVIVWKPGGIVGVKGLFEKPKSTRRSLLTRLLTPRYRGGAR